MKLLKLSNINHQYHSRLTQKYKGIEKYDYQKRLSAIQEECIDFANFYKLNLEENKYCEVVEAVVNFPFLIESYANSNKIKSLDNSFDFSMKLIEEHKPDIIFDHAQSLKNRITDIKKKFSFVKQISTWDCWASSPADGRMGYDLYFTCVSEIRDKYLAAGQKCMLNPFGFEKRILNNIHDDSIENKVCFIGSISSNQHNYRNDILNELRGINCLNWWIGNIGSGIFTRSKIRELLYLNLKGLIHNFPFELHNRGMLFGLEMYKTMHHHSMTLNVHGDFVKHIGNMRLSEASGVGSCQLIDYKDNAKDYFDPDSEAVFFKDKSELLNKVKYLLEHPEEAAKIGKAGQQRVLRDHSFQKHAERFWQASIELLNS